MLINLKQGTFRGRPPIFLYEKINQNTGAEVLEHCHKGNKHEHFGSISFACNN